MNNNIVRTNCRIPDGDVLLSISIKTQKQSNSNFYLDYFTNRFLAIVSRNSDPCSVSISFQQTGLGDILQSGDTRFLQANLSKCCKKLLNEILSEIKSEIQNAFKSQAATLNSYETSFNYSAADVDINVLHETVPQPEPNCEGKIN